MNACRAEEINTSPPGADGNQEMFGFTPSPFSKKEREPNSGKMVLWETSPPSSWFAGFPNKVAISCPNKSSLNLLACHAASSRTLDLVNKFWCNQPGALLVRP